MATANISSENMKLAKEYAKKKGMSVEDCINHFLPRGIRRQQALDKHRKASGAPVRKKKAAKKTTKKKAAKTAKRSSKKASAKKTSKTSNGAAKVTDSVLQNMKKNGMSNPQIAKETGLSKDQVYRRLKAAAAA